MRIRQLRAKKITKPTNKYLNLKSFGNSFKQMNDLCRIAMVHANKEALSEDIVNRFQILFEIIDKLKQYGTTWQIIQQVLFDKNYTYEQSKQPYSRSSSQQLDFPQERKDNNPITRVILKQGHLHLIDFVRIHINLLALLYQYGEGKLSQEDLQNSLIEQIRQTNEENLEQSQNYLLIKPIRNIIEEDKQQSEVESEQSESEVKKLKVNQYSEQSLKNISHKFKKYLLELEFNPKNKQNSKKQEFKANTYQCELQKQKQKQKLQQLIIIKGKLSKSQQDQFTNSKLVEEKMQLQYQYQQHIQSRHLDKLITREPRQKKLEFKMGTFGFNRQLLELQNSTNTLIKKEQQQKDSDIRTLQKNKCEQISLSQLQKRKMLNLAKKNQIAEIKRYSIKLVKNKLISLNLKSNDDLSYKANSCKKQFKEINVQTANKGDLLKNKVFDLTVQSGNQLIKHQKLQKNPEYNCNQQKVYHIQYDLNYNNEEILKRRLEKNTQQRTLCQHISQINQELSNLNTFYLVEQQQQSLLKMQQCNKLLGGGCACSSQIKVETVNPVQRNGQYQIKQIIDGKEKLKKEFVIQNPDDKLGGDDDDFKDFNEQYDKYINTQKVSEKVIETQVRRMVEITLYDYREQIVQTEIRHKVIDLINLLINYFLIIKQNNSKQSIQSDINLVGEYLQKLIIYCKENKERHPCLDLYQYFDILKTLNSQRIGLDVANQSVVIKIIQKVVQVVKFGAGFVSIAGAIKNLTEINLSQINNFVNEIKQIVQQVTSQSSTDAIKIGLGSYSDYNTNNIANNLQALWLKKVLYMGEALNKNDYLEEIIFYLEESPKISNKDSQLFVYMQLNYLLSKQQMQDNFDQLNKRLGESNKIQLIVQLSNILQVKEYSDDIFNKIKNIASMIAQSSQFRYIKAQLLLYFAQILQLSSKNEYNEIMVSIVSNYLQEKQAAVKIIYKNNQIIADFIHQHLDKSQILIEISSFKNQITKHLDDKQQYNDFAYDIQTEKDLDKQLAKYYVEIWEQSVKQRQKRLEIAHKDDVLLEAIHLYVNQQITYQEGYQINTIEKDAVKQIIDQFLIPNFVISQDDAREVELTQRNIEKSNQCKIISILAEGGSGKSMLLKKIEVELLNRNSDYTKDNRSDFIPFIIKCNSLDREKPSIEDYLESVNIKRKDIDNLKKSERNKLIMLDGYDEYTGDYFNVYQKLNLYEWVNTLVIVTSRLEKINVSDAKIYFNYYDQLGNQGESNQFGVFKLEKITKQDIEDYLNKYKEQQQYENQEGFDEKQHKKLKELIFRNKQLTELLKLPINLYLTTRMITDLNLNDQSISNAFQEASDQVDIQELFFSQQFKKQSQNFIEQQKQLNLNNKEKQQLIEKVESCYFEYFQSIAMQMFIQKGSKFNFLSITRDSIQFQPREEVLTVFKQNQILVEDFLKKLKNYVDSRVITRIQLNFDAQDSVDKSKEKAPQQDQLKDNNEKQQEFEFRHKSLFEYFAARAMKYDFDLHKEEIYKLDISQLKQFNINKKIIMSNEKNASEFQILLKLFRLIKPQIDSQSFIQKITNQETSQTNRYIQFINNSQISKDTEKSQIDVGASNLLSALFFSKFSFPNLIFKKCSFSQAYIPSHSSKLAIFQDCNLSEALIEKYNLDKYETSNTKNAVFGGFQVQFDSQNIYSFQQVIFYKSTLISITENGFINQFEFQNNNKFCKLLSSKQITNSSLHSIHFVSSKNIFLVRATKSLFEIDAQTFETLNTFTFSFAISTLQINNLQYFVNLINNEIFHGDMQNGFSLLNTIQAQKCLSFDNYIITLQNKETIIQNLKNLEILKVMKDVDLNLTRSQFTPDGKYLLMISNSETLQIWSVEKEFELVKTIEGHTVFKMTFSEDGKYLATSSFSEPITCKIWSIENEFQLMQTIETGHKDLIHTLSFSADGKYVSTASFLDNFCQIWNIESGNNKLVNQIQGHTEYISTLTFSPDNKFLATCSKDETCRIWNTEKGFELIQTIETGHTQLISQASFSADSKYLATSSLEGNAKIWSVNQGFKLINTIQGHTDSISSIAFSTDGKYLATGSKDKTCKIWNILKGFELQTTIQGHTDSIKSVNFSVDNKYLFTGSKDHTCKIWNVNQGFELIQTIQGHTNSITCVASSRDGNYLATTSKDYSCKIWNIQKGFTLVNTIIEANAYMQQVAFSEDGKYLAIGQGDNTCQIWSVLKGFEKVNIIDGLDFAFITIAFSQNGKYLATGCRNSNFKVWNFEKGFDFINKIDTQHTSTINSVSFSSDGRYLVTGSQDNTYKIWSTEKGFDYLGQIEGHKNTILSVVFSEDSKYLATCSGDKTCKIWNVQKGFELIKTIEAHKDWVCSVAFSSNSKYLATGSWDKTCKIWNLERDFELVNNIEGHTNKIQSVAFSANNKYLATSSEDKTFKIWNPAKGFSLVVTIQQEKAEHLAFSVDSKYLVQGTNVWSVEKGFQFLKSIDGHTRISSIALSKNGKYLATTGSLYKTCKIWNIEKGFDLIYTFEEQSSFILSCGFSEDCKYLAIGLQDCTCKIWNIEKGLQDSYQIDQKIINENENKLNHQYIISKNIFYQAFQV